MFKWKQWNLQAILIVLPPLLIGTWIGTKFLSTLPDSVITICIAFFVVLVGGKELSARFNSSTIRKTSSSFAGGLLLGFASGLASAIAHAGGVVISAYLISRDLKKDEFKGTILLYLVLADTAKLILFTTKGLITIEMINPILWSIPFLFLGVFAGRKVYKRISENQFRTVVAVSLLGLSIFLTLTEVII